MKRTLIALCAAFALSFVGYVGAQTDQYGGQSNSTAKRSEHAKKSSREVTLSGCLAQGTNNNIFVLKNATEENAAGGTTAGTSGQMGTEENAPMDFRLVASGRADRDLKKYIGQRVQVTGVVEKMKEKQEPPSSTGTSGNMSGTEGTTSGNMGSQTGSMSGGSMSGQEATPGPITHQVKVRSVKQLSSSCQ